jgi:ATP-dependent DNA helicase RecG
MFNLLKGENKYIEYKKEYFRTFLKTVSAFANFNTGKIVFGIDDNENITGIDEIDKVRLSIENSINDCIFPLPFYEISKESIKNKSVIILTVYKGEQAPYTFNNKAYKRSDTSTIEVDRTGYEHLILEGRNLTYEMILNNDDLSFSYFSNQLLDKLNIAHIDDDILTSFELKKNKKHNNAAALIADNNPITTSVISFIKYGKTGTSIIEEMQRMRKTSILKQFFSGIEFLKKHLPAKEIIEKEIREKIEIVPIVAYREALANALVHRDYSRQGEIRVEILNDCVEIISPGGLPNGITESEYHESRLSIPRNRIITDIFLRLGIIERLGTGIRRIKEQYKDNAVKPEFSIMENSIKVVLPFLSRQADRKELYIKEHKAPYMKLTDRETGVINYILEYGSIKRNIAEKVLGLSKTQTYETLNKMIGKEYIIQIGQGRATKYILWE